MEATPRNGENQGTDTVSQPDPPAHGTRALGPTPSAFCALGSVPVTLDTTRTLLAVWDALYL